MSRRDLPALPDLPDGKLPSLGSKVSVKDEVREIMEENMRRILFLIDATGSMSYLWDLVSKTIQAAIKEVTSTRTLIEIEWLAYRDFDSGDKVMESSGWLRDPDEMCRFVGQTITCHGGGSSSLDPSGRSEAVEAALKHAAKSEKAQRIVLIGDAPPHPNSDWREQTQQIVRARKKIHPFLVETCRDADLEKARTIFSEIAAMSDTRLHVLHEDPTELKHVLSLLALAPSPTSKRSMSTEILKRYMKNHQLEGTSGDLAKDLLELPTPED